jgi:tRNA (guanine-N7-)-methyltransferase
MGRRALRKVDPTIDLSRHLLSWDQLPDPWDAAHLFGRRAPVEIEVGSGKGLFLRRASTTTPAHDFLGIELALRYARFAAAQLAKQDVPNGKVVCGDAQRLFSERLPSGSLAAVHVYFPDPWWKKRHAKRRIMNATFLRDVERALAAGGVLHFWTDVEAYFRAALATLAAETTLDGPHTVAPRPADHDLDYQTHFERRVRLVDQRVFRAMFYKNM